MDENKSQDKYTNKDTIEKSSDDKKDKSSNPKEDFENIVYLYLASNPVLKTDRKTNELEIRFGTNSKFSRPISKIDYENTVKKLYNSGFKPINSDGMHILRIQNEYTDTRTGFTKISNIRAEMVGIDLIQEYCKSNDIQKIISMVSANSSFYHNKVKFTQKSPPRIDDKPVRAVDFKDFNFRVSYQLEQDYTPNSNIARNIIGKWTDSKKIFRYINRVRFQHESLPIFADISIVKTNKKTNRVPIPQYTIQDAGVFENIESYEIELEVDNSQVGDGTLYYDVPELMEAIRKCIRIVLSALQDTNYPISYHEQQQVIQSYMKLIHGDDYQFTRINNNDFIGPSSYTLQLENVIKETEGSLIPNIRKNYTVTDKADGDRKLLYISDNGRIYMIDTNMNVIFTGTMTDEKTLHNSLLDGEHIKYNKHGKFINLYAAFDIYYINKKSVREFAFMKIPGEEEELDNKYRLLLLIKSMKLIKPYSVLDTGMKKTDSNNNRSCDFIIKNKVFYVHSNDMTIFEGCAKIISDIDNNIYEYNTDGLIFTPCNTGVGSNRVGIASKLYKTTWEMSFKWKPPQYNTIDFLVSFKKDKNGKDEIHTVFKEGMNLTNPQNILQYKTLVLRCGFNENDKRHGFLNPSQNIIDDILPSPDDDENNEKYKPVPFQPTNPYDPTACFCNILLHDNGIGSLVMKTEEKITEDGIVEGGEYFEEDMIVEFKYDNSLEKGWKWIPIKVRYDKTAELRSGKNNFGNAYHVANSNWHSIHNPITKESITTGIGFPQYTSDDDVYYNRYSKDSNTIGLRNFHNLYVKKKIIVGVSNRKDTLIDFAVGKAGDLSKWREAKLGFVFGIDYARDNIHNNIDGACARYLRERKNYKNMHSALFVVGNSGLNIRSGEALSSDKDKMIAKAVFGNGPKDRSILGEGVYKHYGIAQNGFNISSCQFALHYFFENISVLHKFLQNIAECTIMGGYFIGTCYDGKEVFNLLKNKLQDESIVIMKNDRKIYEIIKRYNETGFQDDETSIGYAIDVYQETINKVFREYLVNFNYFIQIMEDYGFVLISKEEANTMDLPNGTGLFNELFTHMQNEINRNPRKIDDYGSALDMSDEERKISFLNRYFIFKKMRTVNTDKLAKIISKYHNKLEDIEEDFNQDNDVLEFSKKIIEEEDKKEASVEIQKKPIYIRKIKKAKFVIDKYSPIVDSPEEPQNKVVISENIVKPTTQTSVLSEQIISFKKPKNKTKISEKNQDKVIAEKKRKPKIKIIDK